MDERLFAELWDELTEDILPFWMKRAKDAEHGGFYGAIGSDSKGDPTEWRGIVMVSRFLWTYSAAARFLNGSSAQETASARDAASRRTAGPAAASAAGTSSGSEAAAKVSSAPGSASCMEMAAYAYAYMMQCFADSRDGGMFWSVTADGSPLVTRKQVYGNAFALYALSEYAAALRDVSGAEGDARSVMDEALRLFCILEEKAQDRNCGGYWEALARDWQPTQETRLSDKDIDCDKSMNTNLHVMEAYTNLYRTLPLVCPEKQAERRAVGTALEALVRVHADKILDRRDWHLDLYFNADWSRAGEDEISYGHDIEASWLLWEAAEVLGDEALKDSVRPVAVAVAETALREGWDESTGGFEDTMSPVGERRTVRIWWNQAEALNGFYNAWEMTGEAKYAAAVEKTWAWIRDFQRDREHGEWFWAVSKEGKPALQELKGGNWKTSYHNARCCMELLRRRR